MEPIFHSVSKFLSKFSSFYRHLLPSSASPRHRDFLPLPFPSNTLDSSLVLKEASKVYDVLEDIMGSVLMKLHIIQKNLQFWESRAEGSNARKLYFMVFERGPRAFVDGTSEFFRECVAERSISVQQLCQSVCAYINERIIVLSTLRFALATFLAELYMEVDKCGEELVKDPEKTMPALLVAIDGLFSKLEASIGHLHALQQFDSSVEGSYSFPSLFEKLPELIQEGSQWTDSVINDSTNLVYKNLEKLDSFLSLVLACQFVPCGSFGTVV